jgi:cell division protein FtsA
MALHTPLNVADKVKLMYGSLTNQSNELIEIPVIGDVDTTHEVSLDVVHNVIYARVEETLMILAQFIENSGLKDQIGAGIVLTGGFSKMEGIRELAAATFGSIPVRLARPIEMNGLFDELRSAEFSSAVGLVMYSAFAYTPYEIDVNKRVRHTNELPTGETEVNFSTPSSIEIPVAPSEEEIKKPSMVTLDSKKDKQSDESGGISKFWNWATQLF